LPTRSHKLFNARDEMADSGKTLKRYTLAEVEGHNEKKSSWLVIHDNVYDVTSFLEEHPGGEEVLLEQSGKDATESFEDVGHSSDARELMASYLIGELVEEDKQKTKKVQERTWGTNSSGSDEPSGGSWRSWLLPVGFALAATVFYRYYLHYYSVATNAKQ